MTEEEIRVAVAEVCGWEISKIKKYVCGETWKIRDPEGNETFGRTRHFTSGPYSEHETQFIPFENLSDACEKLPDYLNDLNAIREAEMCSKLAGNWLKYERWLKNAGGAEWFCAPANIRASVFLRVLGLWVD